MEFRVRVRVRVRVRARARIMVKIRVSISVRVSARVKVRVRVDLRSGVGCLVQERSYKKGERVHDMSRSLSLRHSLLSSSSSQL